MSDGIDVLFSKLHLGLLEILLHNSQSNPALVLVNSKQISLIVKNIIQFVKTMLEKKIADNLGVSLDRLAKFILVVTETNCCSGNLGKLAQ